MVTEWGSENESKNLRTKEVLLTEHFANYTSQTPVEIYGKQMVRLAFPCYNSRLNASGTGREEKKGVTCHDPSCVHGQFEMFTLLSGLWHMFQKDEYYVLIVGLDNAGKTTLLEQIKRKFSSDYQGIPFEKITNTVGLNIGKIELSGVKLSFWDLGGHEDLQSLWDKYYEECHGLIFVVDSVDEERLGLTCKVLSHMLQSPELESVPLLVLLNKQDSQNALSVENIKDTFKNVSSQIGRRDCSVQPVSALDGDGVENGIDWMVRCVKRNIYRPAHTKYELA